MQKSKPRTSSALTSFFAPGFLSKEDRHHISYMDFHTNWASVIIHIPLAFLAPIRPVQKLVKILGFFVTICSAFYAHTFERLLPILDALNIANESD